ncbi:multiple epidermal growth factor-like domains protein 6 [Liolophura sinensis]|uniref:multiple epidermal growth factor-like domains protein 6 n=1 Tax=Liolophura sinensis TaxID=3198878 RepID=UPI0031593AD3
MCNCRTPREVCHKITGQCSSGCPDGFTGMDCYTVCPRGRFGEGCWSVCHCKNVSSCNNVDGTCQWEGCSAGYKGDNCQEACPRGWFGEGCQSVCHCKNVVSCNYVDGTCNSQGCAAGYKGYNCQEVCPRGLFGEGCQSACHCKNVSSCNNVDGTCNSQGCAAGYKGSNCQEACPRGWFGEGCQSVCHCKNVDSCNYVDGTCNSQGCTAGYKGYNCQEVCPRGWFGEGCWSVCHCKNVSSCNNVDGTCQWEGCRAGYKGDNCQEACPRGWFGEECQSVCHCKNVVSCYYVDGTCDREGCAAGYKGSNCQEGNMTIRKLQNFKRRFLAKNSYSIYPFDTHATRGPALVDVIGNVLFSRMKAASVCSEPKADSEFIVEEANEWLHHASRRWYPCPRGWFGEECQSACHCKNVVSCYYVDGTCDREGCTAGYKGSNCQEACPRGWFGEGCQSVCHCKNVDSCNYVDGTCDREGCAAGYKGYNCQEVCPRGWFGEGCQSVCHCKNVDSCNYVDGTCDREGCTAGYKGSNCQEACPRGWFGEGCQSVCHCKNVDSCNYVDGTCDREGCAAGYKGYNCQEVCPRGWFGEGCQSVCHCKNVSSCNNADGTCNSQGCAAGYKGSNCQEACPRGWFGEGCQSVCHCKNVSSCNNVDGTCNRQGCAAGYKGSNCQEECTGGHFGEGCVGVCHCQNEASCNEVNGTCDEEGCEAGYKGENCQEGQCLSGIPPCELTCHCSRSDLNPCPTGVQNGCATDGCRRRWSGTLCQRRNVASRAITKKVGSTSQQSRKHSFDGDKSPKLWRQLQSLGVVYSINITMWVTDNQSLNAEFHIEVDRTSNFNTPLVCYTGIVTSASAEHVFNCSKPVIGQFVRILVQGHTKLFVQEFEIYRCGKYWFGYECDRLCNCRNATEVCDVTNGTCRSGCPDGFTGIDCYSVCQLGSFGKDCALECHCKNEHSCNKVDGTCDIDGCASGFKGDTCQEECSLGEFGEECLNECHCKNQESCNRVTGQCGDDGCAAGYRGHTCQNECDFNTYGENCLQTCGSCLDGDECNKVNGSCLLGCEKEFTGELCQEPLTSETSGGSMAGGIVGAILGVLFLLLVAAVILYRRRSRKGRLNEDVNQGNDNPLCQSVPNDAAVQLGNDGAIYTNSSDVSVSHMSVHARNLLAFVNQKLSTGQLPEEFKKLPTGLVEKTDDANKPYNINKCRYKGILPYDHNRVYLTVQDGNPKTDFINASYINGYGKVKAFIASQGTMAVNIADFWRMVWEREVGKIVMLARLFEKGKLKVLQYWPDEGIRQFGEISVETIDTKSCVDYTVRTLKVQMGDDVRTITQFHYLDWPDHAAPRDTSGIIALREKINKSHSDHHGPIIVHCSAGVGRTGTFIAFDYLIRKLEAEQVVDIFQTVVDLRHQRTMLVQNMDQYIFLHKVLRDAYISRGSCVTIHALMRQEMHSVEFATTVNEKYKKLEELRSPYDENLYSMALSEENKGKNRDPNCVPADMDRVWLSTPVPGRSDYINAMFVLAEGENNGFVTTQMPFGDTRIDYWRLVYEQKSSLIVLLNSLTEADDTYWPTDETAPLEIGPFTIALLNAENSASMTEWKLTLTYNRMNNPAHLVNFCCFTGWPEGEDALPFPRVMVQLKADVFRWQSCTQCWSSHYTLQKWQRPYMFVLCC